MKKILSSFAIFTLIASTGTGSVIACSSSKHHKTPQTVPYTNIVKPGSETASKIAQKIINKTIYLNSVLGTKTSNPYTAQSILGVLKSINSDNMLDNSQNLTKAEVQTISLASVSLTEKLQTVKATIYGAHNTTAVVNLQIAINPQAPNNSHYAPYFDMGQLYKYNLNTILSNYQVNTVTAAFLQHVAGKDVATAQDPIG